MGALKDPNYVREFALRTKLNYYRNKLTYESEHEDYSLKIKELEEQMRRSGYSVEKYYEVTDLINSFVGLLVFPEQNAYESIDVSEEAFSSVFPELYLCTKGDYINTYESNGIREADTAKNIIRHIRNAVSHYRVMIYPRSGKSEEKIESIIVQDYKTDRNKSGIKRYIDRQVGDIRLFKDKIERDCHCSFDDEVQFFSMEIPVERLEKVVMEICDYLLSISG